MSVARIQIDFALLEGESLADFLTKLGDAVLPILDDHAEDEPCVRWISIEACQYDDETYEVEFTPDEEEQLNEGVGDIFRDAFPNN